MQNGTWVHWNINACYRMRYLLTATLCCMAALSSKAQDYANVFFNEIMVVAQNDTSAIEGTSTGTVKFTDKGFKSRCSYVDAMSNIVYQCRKEGGNLVKIVSIKQPDMWSSCYRITAKAYKVADPQKYEKEIQWSASRKLTPADFKGTPDDSYPSSVVGLTYAGFGFRVNKAAFQSTKVHVFCRFYCYESWIRQAYTNDARILKHEQAHFDIAEIYARKLFKALTDANLNTTNMKQANDIYKELFAEFKNREAQYDNETAHGTIAEQQQKWYATIYHELSALPEYETGN